MGACLLGIDVGSSSIKAALIDIDSGETLATAQSPTTEMAMDAPRPGWAEQDPNIWWHHIRQAVNACLAQAKGPRPDVKGIGITYQMHGLVCIDSQHSVIRPSIIWCDSRAVAIGDKAFAELGSDYCLKHLLNSPGNFTASKLRWVLENEKEKFDQIKYFMLPGDYIAMKLTGEPSTTASGLSEGIFWDYPSQTVSQHLLDYYQIPAAIIPPIVSTFNNSLKLSQSAADELGLKKGTPVSYRAGDQPNNAFSLNVLNPGEVAATAGTSGVIYAVTDKHASDSLSRVNTFIHVNDESKRGLRKNGILLCINGTGIFNSWLRKLLSQGGDNVAYETLNDWAAKTPVGCGGLMCLPFGNGAERILANKEIDSSIEGLNFNKHGVPELARAVQEGIVFAMRYGADIISSMGQPVDRVRAGAANLFLSPVFREAFVNTLEVRLELYNTDGAVGAARGAGVGIGCFKSFEEAFRGLKVIEVLEPDPLKTEQYKKAYSLWLQHLTQKLQS
ncbi:MAG: xylulokinase [Cyclobacteriaceae bacterium]